ncbi:MAG TPA: C39 family peptidase [Candidatus Dormibacteraeota bacterium]|nr:C39 family peptidase [Candidatus Dormibacteraeota bacterium]
MIAVEHEEDAFAARLLEAPPAIVQLKLGKARPRWPEKLSALALLVSIVTALGGGGLLDSASVYVLQAKAQSLHARWAVMRDQGIPDADLAELEQEWTSSQASIVIGAGGVFWLPGGADVIGSWQARTDAIWSADLDRFRSDALAAERTLHKTLAPDTSLQRKARLDAYGEARTPGDFAVLRDEWTAEARLIPIDRRIASSVAAVAAQMQQARTMGIRSDPASDLVARAGAYAELSPSGRLSHAEFLTRSLTSVQVNLQGRLDAAAVTQQSLQRAADGIGVAGLYGIDLSGFQDRLGKARLLYANALSVNEFAAITATGQQIVADADSAVNVVLSQTHVISGVSFIYQNHPLSCEEAATSMALSHQGISLSQDEILAEIGADRRGMYVDAYGRVRWGNPYETFVGNVNGSESNYTGFGTFYPPLVRAARAHGASIIAYGSMSAATIYARVIAGHPVVAFSTWDWAWHPRRDYLSFDGQWIPWIGPVYASHVYTVVGVSPGEVLVNDPIRGQYWISKAAFEAGYSDFNEAIVFA